MCPQGKGGLNLDKYELILKALDEAMHVKPDEHMCDIRGYNNYVDSLRYIKEIRNLTTQIIVDDPDELLDMHQIIITWKVKASKHGLRFVDIPERETKALSRMMEKANMSEISYDDSTLTLTYLIYHDTVTS